ncbi:MAG: hypothetical protein GY913_20180 [Proteobacteria bacterium]|nr:hypothetical protein [Pseudomonadota bacterium]MCP4919225.1 hypothetical protein [Pseudomonadota bacterium]
MILNLMVPSLLSCGSMEPPGETQQAPDRYAEMEKAAPASKRAKDEGGSYPEAEEEPSPAVTESLSVLDYMDDGEMKLDADITGGLGGLIGAKGMRGEDKAAAVPTRSWFPETMLWAPSVVTDDAGLATVGVTVPDSLTSWRVLALGASRDGAQAGATHTFRSSLPVQIDLRVPDRLRVGDRVQLPIRVVNTTVEDQSGQLDVVTSGVEGGGGGAISIGARQSQVETVTIHASRPGPGAVQATLAGQDAVVREVTVVSTGRPLTQSRSGILGSEDSLTITSTAGAEHAEVRLTLFPGPLGVIRSELARSPGGSVSSAAYSQLLANRGDELLTALGAPPDEATIDALRTLRLRSQQKLVGPSLHAGAAVEQATILVAVSHSEDPLAEGMASRARDRLTTAQAGDGTWPVQNGATLQQLLVSTAWIVTAVDDPGASVRARGAFERYSQHLLDVEQADPYTAALVLRAGVDSDALREGLEAQVAGWDGKVPDGVVRPDGRPVRHMDVLAAVSTVLPDEARRDAVSSLIAGYRPGVGFGDPLTAILAIEGITSLDAGEPPDTLDVVLTIDGEEAARHELRRSALGETASLRVDAPRHGEHTYAVVSDGAWPGLAWHLDVTTWVPWEGGVGPQGLDVEVGHRELTVGSTTTVTLLASAPMGEAVTIDHYPPAGFVVDADSVTGGISTVDDERVRVKVGSHDGLIEVTYEAVPTLAGTLHTGATRLALQKDEDLAAVVPPEAWTIR